MSQFTSCVNQGFSIQFFFFLMFFRCMFSNLRGSAFNTFAVARRFDRVRTSAAEAAAAAAATTDEDDPACDPPIGIATTGALFVRASGCC